MSSILSELNRAQRRHDDCLQTDLSIQEQKKTSQQVTIEEVISYILSLIDRIGVKTIAVLIFTLCIVGWYFLHLNLIPVQQQDNGIQNVGNKKNKTGERLQQSLTDLVTNSKTVMNPQQVLNSITEKYQINGYLYIVDNHSANKVIINQQIYSQGDSISPEVMIDKILMNKVILLVNQKKIELLVSVR